MWGKSKQDKLMEQVFELKFTARSLQKEAQRAAKAQKAEEMKVKKAIEKGNMDGARIYAQNAIRKKNEEKNYLQLSSKIDGVVSRLNTQATMQSIVGKMGLVTKALDSALQTGNIEKITTTMTNFEKLMEDSDVMAGVVEETMAGTTALSTPENEVDDMVRQIAEQHGLEVAGSLPQAGREAVKGKEKESVSDTDDLSQRLAALKSNS